MKLRIFLTASFVILALSLASCAAPATSSSAGNSSQAQATPNTPPSAGAVQAVTIQNYSFNPGSITVKVGTKVTWTNQDSVIHTVTSKTGLFDSGDLSKGQIFSYTFNTAGTYPYLCTHHANMTGTVIVTN